MIKKKQKKLIFILLFIIFILIFKSFNFNYKKMIENFISQIFGESDPQGTTLYIGETNLPRTLNPFDLTKQVEYRLVDLMYDPLFENTPYIDEDYIKKVLLDNFTKDTSQGTIVWSFELKKDIKWSNGDLISIEDLEYTFKRSKCSKHRGAIVFKNSNYEIRDNILEVIFNSDPNDDERINSTILNSTCFSIPLVKNYSFDVCTENMNVPEVILTEDKHKLIGTGPYKFLDNDLTHNKLVFTSNSHFKEPLYFSNIVVRFMNNEYSLVYDTLLNASRRDENPYTDICPIVPFNLLTQVHQSNNLKSFLNSSLSIYCIGFNYSENYLYSENSANKEYRKIFKNFNFRKALTLSIDKEMIINERFPGSTILYGPLSKSDYILGAKTNSIYEPDDGEARSIMKKAARESGMSYYHNENQRSGLFYGDQPVKLEILYPKWDPEARNAIEMIKEHIFNSLRIPIKSKALFIREIQERLKNRNYDLVYSNLFLGRNLDFTPYFHNNNALNYYSYNIGNSQQYIHNYNNAINTTQKVTALADVHNALREEIAAIFLWQIPYSGVIRNDIITGEDEKFDAYNLFKNIAKWKIDNDQEQEMYK